MKGLLIKDLKLLKNMMRIMFIIIIFSVVFSTLGENLFFSMGYVSVFVAIFSVSTISYDEYDNGFAYLFSLPFERKQYVQEKYIFGLGMIIVGVFFSAMISFAVSRLTEQSVTIPEWGAVIVAALSMAVFMISLVLPTQIKYGSEKGRVAMIVIFLAVGVVGYGAYWISTLAGVDLENMLDAFFYSPARMGMIVGIFSLIVIGISYLISLKIIEKKEF